MPIRGSDRPQTCGLRARFPDCLSTHRFAGFDGQQSGRECIFPFRTALRFACAVFRACALRVLGTSALRAFTFSQAFALQKMPEMTYTPQFAMVVLLRLRACSTPLFIGLTTACFAHRARPSCAPSFLIRASFFRNFVNALVWRPHKSPFLSPLSRNSPTR